MSHTPHPSFFFFFFNEVRKTQSILSAEMEEFVSLLVKDYIGDVDCHKTVLLGLERTRNSTCLF